MRTLSGAAAAVRKRVGAVRGITCVHAGAMSGGSPPLVSQGRSGNGGVPQADHPTIANPSIRNEGLSSCRSQHEMELLQHESGVLVRRSRSPGGIPLPAPSLRSIHTRRRCGEALKPRARLERIYLNEKPPTHSAGNVPLAAGVVAGCRYRVRNPPLHFREQFCFGDCYQAHGAHPLDLVLLYGARQDSAIYEAAAPASKRCWEALRR